MIVCDATVVRPPLSGVHYAVRNEVLALLERFPEEPFELLATDRLLVETARARGHSAPELWQNLRSPQLRIVWQQAALPRRLARSRAGAFLALAYTAPLATRTPVLLQVHDTIALRRPELCRRVNVLHMRLLMPAAMRRARWIVTASETVADQVMALTGRPAANITVVPLGVDPLFLSDSPAPLPEALSGGGDRCAAAFRYALFVGTLEPKKGLETLLRAFREAAVPDAVLVLAGRMGWKCGRLVERIDRYDGPGRVVRLGYVDRQTLPALYRAASVCVMPSEEEGFGLPVLEALACGTPVIHSDHPVLCETAGGHGTPFPIGDATALAGLLRVALDRPTPKTAGQSWARGCTWTAWAETVTALIAP